MSMIMSIHTAKAPSVERLEVEQGAQSREESFCFVILRLTCCLLLIDPISEESSPLVLD